MDDMTTKSLPENGARLCRRPAAASLASPKAHECSEPCYLGWQESLMLLTKLVKAEISDQP